MTMTTKGKKVTGFLFVIFAAFLILGWKPVQAHAATYKSAMVNKQLYSKKERTTNGVTFQYIDSERTLYAVKNGKKAKIIRVPSGYSVGYNAVTDGKNIVFVVTANSGLKSYFYQSSATGKNLKKIVSVKNAGWPGIAGYYNKKIYYIDGSAWGNLNCIDVLSKKTKVIYGSDTMYVTNVSYVQDGKYIYFATTKAICFYNAATGKIKKLGTTNSNITAAGPSMAYDEASGYVYFIEGTYKSDTLIATVKRCKPNGSGKKTMLKNIKVQEVKKLTGNSITYIDANGKTKTRKF